MSKNNLIANTLRFVNRSFLPLFHSIRNRSDFEFFLHNIGWSLRGIMQSSDIVVLLERIKQIFEKINEIDLDSLDSLDSIDFEQIIDLANSFKELNSFIKELNVSDLGVPPEILKDLLLDIPSKLLIHRLSRTKIYPVLEFLDIVGYEGENFVMHNGHVIRMKQKLPSLTFHRFKKLVDDPKQYFINKYFPQGINDYGVSNFVTGHLYGVVQDLLEKQKIQSFVRSSKFSLIENTELENAVNQFYILLHGSNNSDVLTSAKVILEHLPSHQTLPKGLVVKIIGDLNFNIPSSLFDVSLSSNLNSEAILLHANGIEILGQNPIDNFEILLSISQSAENSIIIGSETQTRLAINVSSISGYLRYAENNWTWGADAQVKLDFVITNSSEDSFINKILGDEGFKVDIDLYVGYADQKGFYFGSSVNAGFERTYQINKTLFDFLTIHNLKAALNLNN